MHPGAHAVTHPEKPAYVLAASGETVTYRQHLSPIKCPPSIDFEAELPRHPTGKLYKRLLKDRYWQGHTTRIVSSSYCRCHSEFHRGPDSRPVERDEGGRLADHPRSVETVTTQQRAVGKDRYRLTHRNHRAAIQNHGSRAKSGNEVEVV